MDLVGQITPAGRGQAKPAQASQMERRLAALMFSVLASGIAGCGARLSGRARWYRTAIVGAAIRWRRIYRRLLQL
jgi:hypothetical protein